MERRSGLAAGFTALSSGKVLVLLLTAVTVVLSLLAAAPLGPSLGDSFAGTLAGDHILKNHPSFAPTDFFDFLREKRAALAGVRAAAGWAALITLLAQVLFAGGIVCVLGKSVPITLPDFVAGVRRNAWHNVKCLLIFLAAAGASLGVWLAASRAASKKFFDELAPGAVSALVFRAVIVLVALFLYAVFSLLQDFARAARRSDPTVGAWQAYGHARRTLSGRWARALGTFFFWFLLGGAVLLLGIAVEWSAPATTSLAIAVHILVQVAVLTIRPATRIATWGSYLALYDGAQRPPEPAAEVPFTSLPPEPVPPPHLTLEEKPLV